MSAPSFTGRSGSIRLSRREPTRIQSASVRFKPRTTASASPPARTDTLYRFQSHLVNNLGGPVREIRASDKSRLRHEKHWHGATSDPGIEHITVQKAQEDQHVTSLEPVADTQYSGKGAG